MSNQTICTKVTHTSHILDISTFQLPKPVRMWQTRKVINIPTDAQTYDRARPSAGTTANIARYHLIINDKVKNKNIWFSATKDIFCMLNRHKQKLYIKKASYKHLRN